MDGFSVSLLYKPLIGPLLKQLNTCRLKEKEINTCASGLVSSEIIVHTDLGFLSVFHLHMILHTAPHN